MKRARPKLSPKLSPPLWGGVGGGGVSATLVQFSAHTPTPTLPTRGREEGLHCIRMKLFPLSFVLLDQFIGRDGGGAS